MRATGGRGCAYSRKEEGDHNEGIQVNSFMLLFSLSRREMPKFGLAKGEVDTGTVT